MRDLYALKEKLVQELGEYGRKDLSDKSLDVIDKLAHAAKNVTKVIESCDEDDYSKAMSRRSYREEAYVRPDGSYRDNGMSYRRDSMGRYSRSGKDMAGELRDLMEDAPDDRTREEIRKLIKRMEQM